MKDRAAQLRAAGDAAVARHLAGEAGQIRQVLIEKPGLGRTEHFTLTEIDSDQTGEIIAARITGHTHRALIATPL